MNILLSIKPKYAELIKSGMKRYEFRRKISKKAGRSKIFIYSTSPVKKITGVFDASMIYQDSLIEFGTCLARIQGYLKVNSFGILKTARSRMQ